MKIIVEKNIPYVKGLLEPFAEVEYLAAEAINAEKVADAEVLLVRTRTRCDEALLANSKCKFIGTATIGTDHIDLDYCKQGGIAVHNAPGCNAPAVAQYVLSTIGHWMKRENIIYPNGLTIGIVGVGHVGSIVARWARQLGFKVLLNDPPLHRSTGSALYVPLSKLISDADIITFHTPLTKGGLDPTYHLADEFFFNSVQSCRLLINSARGPIVDNKAIIEAIDSHAISTVAIDCWENEPNISNELLNRAFVATPHIAGYSAEGKTRATAMILSALSQHFGWDIEIPEVSAPLHGALSITLDKIMSSYNPLEDTARLNASPETFEEQRNNYSLRHEVKNK